MIGGWGGVGKECWKLTAWNAAIILQKRSKRKESAERSKRKYSRRSRAPEPG